jgi:hypothetical protein
MDEYNFRYIFLKSDVKINVDEMQEKWRTKAKTRKHEFNGYKFPVRKR